jgi:DNA adenine methylase
LLGRPDWHDGMCETVNDADHYLCNFWRALEHDPDAVAFYADRPVNESDLFSIHLWLVNTGRVRIASMEADPDFYDAQVAGWWVWGINSWIGSGWCAGTGPWKLPHLGNAGQGVNRKLPYLGLGQGVNRKLPHLGDAGQGDESETTDLQVYFQQLASRLRRVRVCCGDWSRVVTNGALSCGSTVGIFLDPPYLGDVRCNDLYAVDDHTISIAVRDWAIANGDNPRYRIVLAGYKQEHEDVIPTTWRRHFYSASKAYGTTNAVGKKTGNDANRHNEALWFSPGCVAPNFHPLFDLQDTTEKVFA